jgi:hypothetical protein
LETRLETKIHWSEYRFVGLVVVIVLLLTSLPYAFAVLTAPPDKHFMGFILNVSDHSQYLAWYRGFQTDFLISNKLTPELNPRVFFNLLWWTLGRFGHYTGLNYAVVYQIFRWLTGAFFLTMVYGFASLVFDDVRRRRTAFLVIALGAGLGWLLVVLKYALAQAELIFPLDVYIAEGNSFLCLMAYPHFAEAAGLILLVFWLLLVGERRGLLRYAVFAGLVAQFLGWQHAYDLLIVWGIPAVYIGLRLVLDRQLPVYWVKALLITGVLSWPPALYSVLLTHLNPIWDEVLAQFANAGVYSPTPLHMFILMGLPLVAAVVALVLYALGRLKGGSEPSSWANRELFVATWFVAGWGLAYVPTDFQVHMISSWQVPIGLLATMVLFRYVIPPLERRWSFPGMASLVMTLFVVLVLPTNIYLWAWRFYDLNRHEYPYYLYRDDVAALKWLDDHAAPEMIVLSAYETGRYVPSVAGSRAFLGHWTQTADFYGKRDMVAEFFAGGTDDARRQQILRQYDVDYVLYGPAERALGDYAPDRSAFLALAFSTSRVDVYAVDVQH